MTTPDGGTPDPRSPLERTPDRRERLEQRIEDRLEQGRQAVGQGLEQGRAAVEQGLEQGRAVIEQGKQAVEQVIKPKLRGWLHAGTFPLAVVLGALLVIFSPDGKTRVATGIFAVTAALLFGTSAVYHRGNWSERTTRVLKRWDHANIFLIIAGTYTPFSVLLLPEGPAKLLLWIVWTGAVVGVAFRVLWVGAPRWLYVPVYIAMGWVAVGFLPEFWAHSSAWVLALIVTGGLLYTLGAIVYGTKKPNPSPRWFGFHEVFHAFTVAAFLAHVGGITLAFGGT